MHKYCFVGSRINNKNRMSSFEDLRVPSFFYFRTRCVILPAGVAVIMITGDPQVQACMVAGANLLEERQDRCPASEAFYAKSLIDEAKRSKGTHKRVMVPTWSSYFTPKFNFLAT